MKRVRLDKYLERQRQKWHIVQTFDDSEEYALKHLKRQGFHTLFPVFTKRVPNTNEIQTLPLMPGYVLVEFSLKDRWQPIYSTRGVKRLLETSRGKPASLSDEAVEQIQEIARAESIYDAPTGHLHIDPGTELIIKDGVYAGHHVICDYTDEKRVYVLLSIFGRETKTSVPHHLVDVA